MPFSDSAQPSSCFTAELHGGTKCHPRLGGKEDSLDGRAGRWEDLGVVRPDISECGGAFRPAAATCGRNTDARGMYAIAAGGVLDK